MKCKESPDGIHRVLPWGYDWIKRSSPRINNIIVNSHRMLFCKNCNLVIAQRNFIVVDQ